MASIAASWHPLFIDCVSPGVAEAKANDRPRLIHANIGMGSIRQSASNKTEQEKPAMRERKWLEFYARRVKVVLPR